MNLSLRTPRPDDYARLATWLPDGQACLRWAGPLIPFPIACELLDRQLAVSGGHSYFLDDANHCVVGFGQHWVLRPATVHLGRIIVAPSHRGRGIGRSLCTQLIARAKAVTGAGTVTLRVFGDNHVARVLYESLGFSAVDAESNKEVLFMASHAG